MNRDWIRQKCDRVLVEKKPYFSNELNNRIQKVYKQFEDSLGSQVDYSLLTDFVSSLFTAYTKVNSEIMVQIIQEILSDDLDMSQDDEADEDF